MKKIILPIFLTAILFISSAFTSEPNKAEVQWLSWEEALQLSKTEQKKFFVDLYTNWCGWCKRMDKTTFSNPRVAKYLNDNYYPIKFNAEQKEEIVIGQKTYKFVNKGRRGYNELAVALTGGRMGFPTVVFLNEKLEIIQAIPGFQKPEDILPIMVYFGEDQHKKTPWATFQKEYQKRTNPTQSNEPKIEFIKN